MIDLAIVDDNQFFCSSVESLLSDQRSICLKQTYNSITELFEGNLDDISILLLDNQLYGESGINYIEKIKSLYPGLKIIMLTVSNDEYSIFKSLEKGVNGYLVKGIDPDKIIESIFAIDSGKPFVSSDVMEKMLHFFKFKNSKTDRIKDGKLGDKEEEILFYLTRGLTYGEIADKVFLSESGVKYYLKRIYKKLNVRNRTEATRLFMHESRI